MLSNTINNSEKESKFPKTVSCETDELIYSACLIKIKQCLSSDDLYYGTYIDGEIQYDKCHIIGKMFAFDYANDIIYFKTIEVKISKRESANLRKILAKQQDLISDLKANPELINVLELLIENEPNPTYISRFKLGEK